MKLDGSVEIEGTYPLSPTQQGMLFHSLYAQESGVDIEQMLCVLNEALDVDAFTECWNRLLGRHSALRASFRWEGLSEPLQDVQRSVTLPITIEDWRDLTGEQQQARLESYLRADRKRGFDLRQAPLMRLALFRLAESDYRLVWTFHHIVADGRSHFYILKEVFAFYDALSRGEELKLPAPRPYGEFIAWLQKQDFSQAETFWRNALQGFTGVNTLSVPPTEFTDLGGDERGEQELCLSSNVTQALSNLAQRHQLTLNTLVQGAWAILLSRYSGDQDVVFGIVRAGRSGTVEGAESMVGMFINTVPLRFKVSPTARLLDWLGGIRASNVALRPYEHTPLIKIQSWSDRPAGAPLFESLLVFDRYYLNSALQAQGGEWQARNFRLLEKTIYPLTLYGYGGEELRLKIAYDRRRFGDPTVARMLGHLATLLENMSSTPERTLAELPLVNDRECREILIEWNRTDAQYPDALCLHQLFEAQVERTPEAVAVVFEDQKLTYRELNQKANQLAHHLRQLGVGPDARVAICVERSLEMVIGLLGILKAGAAYVPLDPSYPKERLAFMLDDARVRLVLTQQRLLARVIEDRESRMDPRVRVVCLDTEWGKIARESAENPQNQTKPENLAYVIYTSGSTGRPKGVMVAHRNVVNFLTAMDASIDHEPPGVWLAVTSISFDISVLELFWTLARGFRVIIQGDNHLLSSPKDAKGGAERNIEFSLFYFASNENEDAGDKYRLLVEGAKFADRHGFSAVWTPERHFHAFGGLYPNPSVTSAALATVTRSLKLRAGSVVLPLQNPIRVAEEWAVVDNLSNGRVGVSFASGWHANDFVFAPENYAGRREIMVREIEVVRKLWRGDSVSLRDGVGSEVEVKIFPRPVQRELPIWITAAGSPDTFRLAGESGANLLTHLLGQDFQDLAAKIAIYRQAWRAAGNGPGDGHVTLMLHTFVGESIEAVREKVREPFLNYLKSSSDLVRKLAESLGQNGGAGDLSEEEMKPHWERAFNRYFETSGLFGTPESCSEMVDRLKAIGVDEIACLIDFGVDAESVLSSLRFLDELRQRSNTKPTGGSRGYTLADQLKNHNVSHLQCTPSTARMLMMEPEATTALRSLRELMVGGEALPPALATQLGQTISGRIRNMYGPTETTIWSATHVVENGRRVVPIGQPIANTRIYIVDDHLRPTGVGLPGEILIGGDGVVRGYLQRPDLTAERFIPDPFGAAPGGRLYRTGDLGRYLPDGTIEFLGRLDHQVKILGHRIELGEIEAVLERHPAVREAVAVLREDSSGEPRLTAYLTVRQQPPPSTTELREYVKRELPAPMVPAAFLTLDRLPLTPNGKVDRRALPEAEQARAELEKPFVPPRTALEEVIAATWEKLLGIDRIGIDDNFFELGGHSLFAVRLLSQLRSVFKVDLPLRSLFDSPTVAALAEAIIRHESQPGQSEKIAQVVQHVEAMSAEDVRRKLEEKKARAAL